MLNPWLHKLCVTCPFFVGYQLVHEVAEVDEFAIILTFTVNLHQVCVLQIVRGNSAITKNDSFHCRPEVWMLLVFFSNPEVHVAQPHYLEDFYYLS